MCNYEVANLCFFVITCIFFVGKYQKWFQVSVRQSNLNVPAYFIILDLSYYICTEVFI